MSNFNLSDNWRDNIIDVRDIIERIEELRSDIEIAEMEVEEDGESEYLDMEELAEAREELTLLTNFIDELKGNGGDHQWEGDWYPITLVRDSYFEDYAQELADDIGAINNDVGWPYTCIDWEKAARELQYDYTTADMKNFDGESETYWFR